MIRLLSLLVFLFTPLAAGASSQVKFVSETSVERPLHVAVSRDGTLFVTSKNGTVTMKSADGKTSVQFRNKDADGTTLLKKPNGITLSGDIVYVTDTSRDRVVMFSREGAHIGSFGEGGSAPKEFSNPRGIFVSQGLIYVADYSNDRIQVFGPNGVYLRSIGTVGEGECRLNNPTDVAVDAHGQIYAVDSDKRMVKRYRANGEYAGKLPGLLKPESLAITDNGLFVADRENCNIIKFNDNGEQLFSFGSMGNGTAQFLELAGMYADNQGNVYAADTKKETIQLFVTKVGEALDPLDWTPPQTSVRWLQEIPLNLPTVCWDKQSSLLYAIDDDRKAVHVLKDYRIVQTITIPDWTPAAISIDQKGSLWVADRGGNRLLKFNSDGKLILTVGSSGSRPGYLSRPSGIAISADGLVYVADAGNDRVQVFDTEGLFHRLITGRSPLEMLKKPSALALDAAGNLYVLNESEYPLFCFSPKGLFIRRFGAAGKEKLNSPSSLAVMGNELLVLDAGSGNVKVFDLAGEFIREFGAKGSGKGDFREPSSIVVLDATRLLVADRGNQRLQIMGMVYTPLPPGEFSAKSGMRSVELEWTAPPEPPIDGFRLLRAKDKPENFSEIGRVKTLRFRDHDVKPGVRYYYRIVAVALDGNEAAAKDIARALPTRYKTSPPKGLAAQSQEWSVDLQWAANKEKFVDHYLVYRQEDKADAVKEPIGETVTASYSDGGLEADSTYIYSVTAVSTDNLESDETAIRIKTQVATKPPLEIEVLQMSDIFSNTYKIYETEGIGRLKIINNTLAKIGMLKLSFAIKEFMDFPSEVEIRDLAARDSREVPLKAVFNNKIIELTEDTPVQTEITATYYINQKPRMYTKNHTVNIYEKHRMLWADKERIATFITSKDPVLLEFTRSVVTQYGDISSPLVHAGAIFEYLGTMGMTYLQHPNNPYQITTGKTDTVDYVQYPRDTLKRNSGVCTDLVVLYSAALESLGIRTKLIGIPGHLFMMFALGPATEMSDDDTMNGMLVIKDGYAWVPVELTVVGAPFMKAWEIGSKAFLEHKDQGIEMTDPSIAWGRYKPANLPLSDWRAQVAGRIEVDNRYNGESAMLNKIALKYSSNRFFTTLHKNPNDINALIQLGINFGAGREFEEALKFLDKADKLSPNNAVIKNNLANLHYLQGDYMKALKFYEKAAELDTDDPYILVNQSLCYIRLNKKAEAGNVFRKAYSMSNEVGLRYRAIAMELLGSM